ncbi:hypothetical protein SSBR45G_54930 [Bradyrhizobium sp. SSBR45G]|uniref:hypothetical protein n=1 Tax=unclassified Bradyrhizobium TaxID=2631580 RepID=UPI002342947A|nr:MULTISPECIES: hypothetical protein [unclassified Bradyrhizobium]GLH80584.1 hypothetical protein SSBR45G_54930 [Bradyrhizobium sp. SSBR45G]GLH85790.1 hypothetical protein SSBR45R_32500 [Bradyrhizobium sp. SSBR45R]
MDLAPPDGSQIKIARDGLHPVISIPQSGSPTRYFGGLFLLFWLGGWTMGFKSALSQILSGGGSAFLVFWLGGWTIGAVMAAWTAYRSFRPTVPETLVLGRASIVYDAGVAPFEFNQRGQSKSIRDGWKAMFPKRIRAELTARQLQSLRLRETDLGNRLTVDVDTERIEIAKGASEIEREWLARYLARRYGLSQITAPAAGT